MKLFWSKCASSPDYGVRHLYTRGGSER